MNGTSTASVVHKMSSRERNARYSRKCERMDCAGRLICTCGQVDQYNIRECTNCHRKFLVPTEVTLEFELPIPAACPLYPYSWGACNTCHAKGVW